MKPTWLIWIPRAIIIAFALFTILFSLDSFEGTRPMGDKILGFIIHNIFFFVLSLILVVTWHRPLIAGLLFIVFAIVMIVMFHSRWQLDAFLLIAGPPVLVGVLYIIVHFLDIREIRE